MYSLANLISSSSRVAASRRTAKGGVKGFAEKRKKDINGLGSRSMNSLLGSLSVYINIANI
jgi:hypothetical protein